MPAMEMLHDVDPAKELLDAIGSLDDYALYSSQVLVAIYVRPEKTKSGIVLSANTRAEDEYQGKVGLVVKMGPLAFQSDDTVDFHGQSVKVGDWVVFRTSDAWPLAVNKVKCRMMSDVAIRMVVPAPDKVF